MLCVTLCAGCSEQVEIPDNVKYQSSYQDSTLIEQAWSLPVASRYQASFEYQINWAFCGPAAAVNLFKSTGINTLTQESLFQLSEISYWKARLLGLTLDELTALIQDNTPYSAEMIRNISLDEFRQHLLRSNDPKYRYIINFSRLPLFGVAIGHHSPIGGYLAERDLVFVLDVLDEYKPFLVSSERLYEAMNTVDSETGEKRGLILFHVDQYGSKTLHENN